MVLYLPWKTFSEFERNLLHLIRTETTHHNHSIPFLDCQNTLTKALLKQKEWAPVLPHLDLFTVREPDELLYTLKSIHFRSALQGKRLLVLSPYSHLFDGVSARAEKIWLEKLHSLLEKMEEKFNVHAVVVEN